MRDLLSWLVSGSKDGNRTKRENLLNLKMVNRRLTRSMKKLENQESKTDRKIRAAVQKGDMQAARMYAQDTVRSRKWARGYQSLISKIDGLIFKLDRAEAIQDLSKEMKGVAKTLISANQSLNLPEIDRMVNDMQGALDGIEDFSESMEESVDSLFEGDTDQQEVDNILHEYGIEAGVTASAELPMPSSKVSELEKEIEALRKEEG